MNCVFVNITDKEKIELRSVLLTQDITFTELLVPLDDLNKRVFENGNSVFGKAKSYFYDRKLIKYIQCKKSDNATLYVLPRVLEKADKKSALSSIKRYIRSVLDSGGKVLHSYTGCVKENFEKYLSEALVKLKLEKKNTRLLMVYSALENLDLEVLEKLICEYKTVDILASDIKSSEIKKKIDKINEEYGSSICVKSKITKQEIKTKPYDICMYMEKSDFKLTNAHKIYLWDNDSDKFDKYAILANELGVLNKVKGDYFSYMTKNYGRLNILSLLCKATLDNK